jgi:hypothetical protein
MQQSHSNKNHMVLTQKNRHTDQWNGINPEIYPHSNSHFILDKDAKKFALEKRQPLQQLVVGKLNI